MDDTTSIASAGCTVERLSQLYANLTTVETHDWLTKLGKSVENMTIELELAGYMADDVGKEVRLTSTTVSDNRSAEFDQSTKPGRPSIETKESPTASKKHAMGIALLADIGITALRDGISATASTERENLLMGSLRKAEPKLTTDQKREIARALIGVLRHPFVPYETFQLLARYVIARDLKNIADEEAVLDEIVAHQVKASGVRLRTI
jgi:hypothetical protein